MFLRIHLLFSILCIISAKIHSPIENVNKGELQDNRITVNGTSNCRDSDLTRIMNYSMSTYVHDMGAMAKSIIDQLVSMRKAGKWLAHAQIISGSRQGIDWNTITNGDIFSGKNYYACYYHDTQTYVLLLRLYA